jgi:hypothetical protein
MTEQKLAAPTSHWRRRTKAIPMPQADAVRQGAITHLAFLSLGKDAAIAFLNTSVSRLGGHPLAIATANEAGDAEVRAMLKDLAAVRAGCEQSECPDRGRADA